MKKLSDVEKRSIFKSLASQGQFRVAQEFGLDKYYNGPIGAVGYINRIYREVKEEPEKFAVSQELVELVEKGMLERKGKRHSIVFPTDPGKIDEKSLVVGVRNKAWTLLDQKLNYLIKNRRAFRNESLVSLGKLAGISFDKAQIVRGEATEHIMLKAKIDENITSVEATEQLLKFREVREEDE